MRNFTSLDPTALRAFYFSANSLSFSEAAQKAGLTQSGISQHIAKLESTLEVDLFLRTGKRVAITPYGLELKEYVESYLDHLDGFIEKISAQTSQLKGWVQYSMPNSCLMTPHFSMLLRARKNFPHVDLRVNICPSEDVISEVLSSDSDFGFVTRKEDAPSLHFEVFSQEEYIWVSNRTQPSLKQIDWLSGQDMIRYPGMDVLFAQWKDAHFARSKLSYQSLRFRGEINHLAGALTLAAHGVGLGLFPRHCVEAQLKSGALKEVTLAGDQKCAKLPIYLVKRSDRKLPSRVRLVIDEFWKMVPR